MRLVFHVLLLPCLCGWRSGEQRVGEKVSLRSARELRFMMRRSGCLRHGLFTHHDWRAAPVGEEGFSLAQIPAWIVGASPPMPLSLHETAFSPPERPDGRFPEGMPRRSSQRICKIRSPNQGSPENRLERTFRPAGRPGKRQMCEARTSVSAAADADS